MSRDRQDRELLRSVFAEGHRETSEKTPAFAPMWQEAERTRADRRRPRRRYSIAALAAAAASLMIAAGLIGIRGLNEPETTAAELDAQMSQMAASLSEWRAPLDFLLQTPGSEWLQTTPRLGGDSTPELLNVLNVALSKETQE